MKVYELIDHLLDIVEECPKAQDYDVIESIYDCYVDGVCVDSIDKTVVIECDGGSNV